jgi:hypothetical protein
MFPLETPEGDRIASPAALLSWLEALLPVRHLRDVAGTRWTTYVDVDLFRLDPPMAVMGLLLRTPSLRSPVFDEEGDSPTNIRDVVATVSAAFAPLTAQALTDAGGDPWHVTAQLSWAQAR